MKTHVILLLFVVAFISSLYAQPYAIDLFISEYVEGSSNNKALEIYNGTGAAVNLSQYTMKLASNGSPTWSTINSVTLSGTLANDDVFVIANPAANATILGVADLTHTVTYYNGNDCLGLFHGDTLIDIIGILGEDPGTAWPVAGTDGATLNHTLIRKPDIDAGTTNWIVGAGTNMDNSEWIVHPQDYIVDLGAHTFDPGGSQTVSTPTFIPPGGTYTQAQNVSISCSTPGAQIRYTMDGSEPTSASALYTSPIYVGTSVTLKAKGYLTGWTPSATAVATYNITMQTVATPTFSPPAGAYANPQSVTIACATAGATIYYTTNGADPTESSQVYVTPVNVSDNLTLKARAYKSNMNPSSVATASYEMAYPPISVQATETSGNVNVTWIAPQPGRRIDLGADRQNASSLKHNTNSDLNTPPITTMDTDRSLTGYRVWRFLESNQGNESLWTLLTQNVITTTSYTDTGWQSVPSGTYKWAVKAVYTGNVLSVATVSNALSIVSPGTISGFVRNLDNQAISGATVTCDSESVTSSSNGSYSMSVYPGIYNVTASHPNHQSFTQTGVAVVSGQTTNLNFQLDYLNNLTESFDGLPNFALNFAPWTTIDVDQSYTLGFTGTTWNNMNSPQAYIIFNPYLTTPPLTDPAVVPHSGSRMAASFAAINPPNNDWLISPRLNGVNRLRFWAKSYSSQFGLERFRVGVSTSDTNPSSFVFISGNDPIEPPTTWTEYTYYISQTSPVYFGIQCMSSNTILFMIDDVNIDYVTANVDPLVVPTHSGITGNYPNPFRTSTTIEYALDSSAEVRMDVFNIKGQLVRRLIDNCTKSPGTYSTVWDGKDDQRNQLPSGIYYLLLETANCQATQKLILYK